MRGSRARINTSDGEVDENFWAQAAAEQAAGRQDYDGEDSKSLLRTRASQINFLQQPMVEQFHSILSSSTMIMTMVLDLTTYMTAMRMVCPVALVWASIPIMVIEISSQKLKERRAE